VEERSPIDYFLMAASIVLLFSIRYWREILKLLEKLETVVSSLTLAIPLLALLALMNKTREHVARKSEEIYRIEFLRTPVVEKEKLVEISRRIMDFLREARW